MGITYETLPTESRDVAVYLDGKHVGTIRGVLNGWRYFPIRTAGKSSEGGETFLTVSDCKRSLEG